MTATLLPAPRTAPWPAASRWTRLHDRCLLFGALPFVLVALARSTAFAEGDTYWQITTGVEIAQRGTTWLVEDDSWDAAGTPWHPNSWLFDVLVARAWGAGGWTGLGVFTVLLVSLVGVAVALVGRRLGATATAVAGTSMAAAVPVAVWLSARPQTVSYALAVLAVAGAARVLAGTGARSLVLGCTALWALTALWVNLHLAALGGLAAVGGGAAVAVLAGPVRDLLRRRHGVAVLVRRSVRPAAVVAALAAGCASSPLGLGVVASADRTAAASVTSIPEWAPLWRATAVTASTWVAAALALLALVVAWQRTGRAGSTPTWLPVWVGAVAVLVAGGVTAARFSPMALLVALPAVAALVPVLRPARSPWLARRVGLALLVAIGVAVTGVALTGLPTFGRPGSLFPAASTVAAIPDGCRVLNEYDEGGLITLLRGADGVLVSADGRNDVYGTATREATDRIMAGSADGLAVLAAADVRCLLLRPDRPLVARAEAAGWRVTARDDARVLLVAP